MAPIPRNYVSSELCEGKLVNLDIPKPVTTRATQPMEVIHMDLKGPFPIASFFDHKYILIFVDDLRISLGYFSFNRNPRC